MIHSTKKKKKIDEYNNLIKLLKLSVLNVVYWEWPKKLFSNRNYVNSTLSVVIKIISFFNLTERVKFIKYFDDIKKEDYPRAFSVSGSKADTYIKMN